ncbi:hypothetical protein H5T58_02545 [Candidatus Parcubacteria bacterium]|nr:hypothetical protein [Candidatus Parcubacteria bacterium]
MSWVCKERQIGISVKNGKEQKVKIIWRKPVLRYFHLEPAEPNLPLPEVIVPRGWKAITFSAHKVKINPTKEGPWIVVNCSSCAVLAALSGCEIPIELIFSESPSAPYISIPCMVVVREDEIEISEQYTSEEM